MIQSIQCRKMIYFIIPFLILTSCKSKVDMKSDDSTQINQDSTMIKISLAEWSYHRALQDKKMDNLDFAAKAAQLGFKGIEYVNKFFKDKAQDTLYLNKLNEKATAAGVKQLLIMIDDEGDLGDTDAIKRNEAVQNHHKWVDAAAYLGCHSIRVNARGKGSREEVAEAAVLALSELADYAATKHINVIVENHGGYSSDGSWLSSIMSKINKPNAGTLPDFGNFCITSETMEGGKTKCIEEYDRYKGVAEMMPYAKAVSAKSHDFGELGFETKTDYLRMLEIVKNAGYKGYLGVEYEGESLSEEDGVIATKKLIEKCLKQLYHTKE
ncbi:MAG: sugar phosphate isomerase/epimerase [Saprospiraceae bacterium]|nr:sugar phosphate isomerase/epimerase [Saprospiraceae bacterium]